MKKENDSSIQLSDLDKAKKQLLGDQNALFDHYEQVINSLQNSLMISQKHESALLAEINGLKEVIRIKNDKITKLLIQNPTSNNKDFNMINIELNAYKSQLEEAKREIEDFKLNKRTPLRQINTNQNNVLSILLQQQKESDTPSKPPSIKEETKENSIPPVYNNIPSSSQSDELSLAYTQSEDQVLPLDETHGFPSEPYIETYDARKTVPMVEESFDLRAGNVTFPTSSQAGNTEDDDDDGDQQVIQSSPMELKIEPDSQVSIIKDSQGFDDDEFAYNLPTPQTTTKFRTPKISTDMASSFKRTLQLQTPNDNHTTPMKRPRIKKSKSSELISLTKDLTQHPTQRRDWIIEDFKVNPALNGDIPYAYEVVIRGKARECMHGKTCDRCQKFYEMAGEVPELEGPRWNDELTKPRFDIVTRASRHKELWDRPETPPGFGDFDFPSTQKLKEDRQKSDLMIKRIAYERLYSALHDKRFIFRNEEFNKMVNTGDFNIDENVFVKYLKKKKNSCTNN